MRKRFAGMAVALLAAVLFLPCKVNALSAQSAILLDGQTGRILYEKNGDKQGLIASTTKIMTALVICEQCNVLDRVKIPKEAIGIEGSSMYLKEGEVLTIQELLYGLMLHSGNDAAVALAIYCGGTVEGFVELMNDKAHRLNMTATHFENPNGLDSPGHYSTARDMAVLTAYAMNNPIFAKTVSTKTVQIGQRSLRNHNKLLWRVEGADGVKTGYTKAAGRILISSATRNDRRLIAVTMNDPDDWQDHATLLEDGFRDFSIQQVVKEGDCLGTAQVVSGRSDAVELIAQENFYYALRNDEKVQIVLQGPGFVYAPIVQGQKAGYAYVCVDDCVAGRVSVAFGSTVEQTKDQKQSWMKKLFGGNNP